MLFGRQTNANHFVNDIFAFYPKFAFCLDKLILKSKLLHHGLLLQGATVTKKGEKTPQKQLKQHVV